MGKKQKRRTRLQIPLDQDVYDAITDFAELTGRSRAAVAEELITESVPALFKMSQAIQMLDMDVSGGLREMADFVHQAVSEVRQMGMDLESEADKRA